MMYPMLYMYHISLMIYTFMTHYGNNFIIVYNHTIMKIIWCIKGIETSHERIYKTTEYEVLIKFTLNMVNTVVALNNCRISLYV
jgi:hypothetical protein